VWGADEPKNSSDSKSVRSVIHIVESPEIIMLSYEKTEGDGMIDNQSKGSVEEDMWSSRPETSDPDFESRRGRRKNK